MKQDLTMIELFAGTGMQRRGAEDTDLYNIKILATSDIEKDAMLAYATCHCGLTDEMVDNYKDYPSREEMVEELKARNIGMDFEKNKMYAWEKLIKKKTNDLEKYWLAMQLQNNLGDISKIKELPLADFWFYSSCCQDLSVAGKLKGMAKGSGTRSGLLWEVERLLEKAVETNTQPKYLCLENVKNMVGKQFKPDFDLWIMRLEELGYNTYYKVLNAKECGRCQNRERIFAMSVRKDIDTGKFTFPVPFDNGMRLKDILEKDVDEKYYINTDRASNLIQQLVDKGHLNAKSILVKNQATEVTKPIEVANTLMARDWKGFGNQEMVAIVDSDKLDSSQRLGGLFDEDGKRHQAGSVWNQNGMSPTIDTCQGGYREPCVVENNVIGIKQATKKGYIECELPGCADLSFPTSTTRRGRVQDNGQTSPTITATETGVHYIENIYRIRKLTPKECWLLMGMTFEDCQKCIDVGLSNSALYRIAGNGIVTDCIKLLFEHLYKAQYDDTYVCTDEKMQNFQNPQVD